MFAKRNFNLFHPSKFFSSKKPPRVRNFHKTTLKELKSVNFLYPVHISPLYRKCYGRYTSAELRRKKEILLHEKLLPNFRETGEATIGQRTLINDFISGRTSATDEDWDILLQNVSSLPGKVNELSIDGIVMEQIAVKCNLNLAKDYLRFMKKRGKKFNKVVVMEFIHTCYYNDANLTEEDLKAIGFFTNYLINNFKVMSSRLYEATIKGLTILNDWNKCMEIAEKLVKEGVKLNSDMYSTLIICLLRNQQYDTARKILHQSLNEKIKLFEEVYIKWIEVFQNDPNRLEELLISFKDHNIIMKKSIADYLIRVYSQLPPEQRLEGKFTSLNRNGRCKCCQQKLEKNTLPENEFNEIRDAFLNRVIVGDDVFEKTTPSELQSFYKTVQTLGPFDIVIDGLNVSYSKGSNRSCHEKTLLLERVVDVCFKHDKRIFIIGKEHMKRYTPRIMENIKEKSHMFLINNESEDDPFMIYATLYSGPNCHYVSRDYLRSEKFLLGNLRLCNLFKQWQLTHQILPISVLRGELQNPFPFKFCVQRTTPQSWHIPCHNDDFNEDDLYERRDSIEWLCLKK